MTISEEAVEEQTEFGHEMKLQQSTTPRLHHSNCCVGFSPSVALPSPPLSFDARIF